VEAKKIDFTEGESRKQSLEVRKGREVGSCRLDNGSQNTVRQEE
jgi:hypothetical protein